MAEDKTLVEKIAYPMINPGENFASWDAAYPDTLPARPVLAPFIARKLVSQVVHTAAYLISGECRLAEQVEDVSSAGMLATKSGVFGSGLDNLPEEKFGKGLPVATPARAPSGGAIWNQHVPLHHPVDGPPPLSFASEGIHII